MNKIAIIITSRIQGNVNHALPKLIESMFLKSTSLDNFEILVKFDEDETESVALVVSLKQRFPQMSLNWVDGPRGRGYIDIHNGYNQLLPLISKDVTIIGAMADDFTVEIGWDKAILEAAEGAGDYFIIHQRHHPRNWATAPSSAEPFYLADCSTFDLADVHIIDEAPLWSKKLLDAAGFFPVSFTDAWTINLETVLWDRYELNITRFLDKIYINRTTCAVDQPGDPRWEGDRKTNFDYIKSIGYRNIVEAQAHKVYWAQHGKQAGVVQEGARS